MKRPIKRFQACSASEANGYIYIYASHALRIAHEAKQKRGLGGMGWQVQLRLTRFNGQMKPMAIAG